MLYVYTFFLNIIYIYTVYIYISFPFFQMVCQNYVRIMCQGGDHSKKVFFTCRQRLDMECMDQDSVATELDVCGGS